MEWNDTGEVVRGVHVLGVPDVPVYLVDGHEPLLIDAGFSCLARAYGRGIAGVLGERTLRRLLITHGHFDHVGAVGSLRRHNPGLEVLAAERLRRRLLRPSFQVKLRYMHARVARRAEASWPQLFRDIPYTPFHVNRTLLEGETVMVSPDVSVLTMETPGHTRDCLSFYIPERGILFCSEAAGIGDLETVQCSFLADYDLFLASLRRLARLEVEVLCPGHYRVFTGRDARRFLGRALEQCEEFCDLAEGILAEEDGDIKRTARRIRRIEYEHSADPRLPENVYLKILEGRLRAVKRHLDGVNHAA